jgi:hypothetical protein
MRPSWAFSTFQIRNACAWESGVGRDDPKYITLPSGESRGRKSKYFPENGSTSGALHFPSRQSETQSSPILEPVVVGFSFAK